MGDCTKHIKWIKEPTYEDVKLLYTRFENAANQMDCAQKHVSFNFSSGSLGYTADSLEEFIEKAYGDTDFQLTALQFWSELPTGESIRINYLCGLSISATNKVLLENFENRLNLDIYSDRPAEKQRSLAENMPVHTAKQQSATQGIANNPITVNGSGNIINVGTGSISDNTVTQSNEIQREEKMDFAKRHPLITAVIASVLAGIILMFNCWENIVGFIESLVSSILP